MMPAGGVKKNETCMLCGTEMQRDETGALKCPACGFVKKEELKVGPGTILAGKYRVLNSLGSGGCGDIFLCHPLDDVSVRYALKIQKDNSAADSQRFEREAMLLKQLNANHVIVDLIDYWTEGKNAYMILEYITGQNLKKARQTYKFDELMTLQIAHEICYALAYAWNTLHMIHRDIKPANIMLDKDGYIRLLDFGMSKSLDEDSDAMLTMQRTGLGTPGYMSPEQYLEAKDVDFRSDLFSVGATMYFTLTGEKPFKSETFVDAYQETVSNTPPPKSELTPYCSEECADLITHLMEKNPLERPNSYEEVLERIQALMKRLE